MLVEVRAPRFVGWQSVVERLLLQVRQDRPERRALPQGRVAPRPGIAELRHVPESIVAGVRSHTICFMLFAHCVPRRFPGRLHRRQKQRHENADHGNHDQQFDEGESPPRRVPPIATSRHANISPAPKLRENPFLLL